MSYVISLFLTDYRLAKMYAESHTELTLPAEIQA